MTQDDSQERARPAARVPEASASPDSPPEVSPLDDSEARLIEREQSMAEAMNQLEQMLAPHNPDDEQADARLKVLLRRPPARARRNPVGEDP